MYVLKVCIVYKLGNIINLCFIYISTGLMAHQTNKQNHLELMTTTRK